jgi:hypothetical protein
MNMRPCGLAAPRRLPGSIESPYFQVAFLLRSFFLVVFFLVAHS